MVGFKNSSHLNSWLISSQHQCHGQAPHAYDFVGGLFHILLLHSVLSSGFGLVQFKSSPLSYPKLAKLAGNVRRDKKSLFNFLYPSYLNLTDTFFFFHSDGRLTSLREQSSRNTNVRNKYEVEALLDGAMQASRMQIVNSGNFFLKAPSEQRNLLFIQPEELQYPSPDSLDDFLQAMNFLNKIYYFPMRSTAHVS